MDQSRIRKMHRMSILILLMLHLFFRTGFAVEHYLKHFISVSSGTKDTPEFLAFIKLDDVQIGNCNSTGHVKELEKKLAEKAPELHGSYVDDCKHVKTLFSRSIENLNQQMNQIEGAHTCQRIEGCKWDDEIQESIGFSHFGYDGEDFISLDPKTSLWVADKPEAMIIARQWNEGPSGREYERELNRCLQRLKRILKLLTEFRNQKAAPSMSLLQKTPSSPVSCHVTGFYLAKAVIFWRRYGQEVHEDVQNWEVLPNHDGTFQKTVVLHISLMEEDWGKYECVFYQSGVEENVTRLDRGNILTNWVPPPESPGTTVVAVIVPLLLLLALCILGVYLWRIKRRGFQSANSSDPSANQTFPGAANQQMTQVSEESAAQTENNKESCS